MAKAKPIKLQLITAGMKAPPPPKKAKAGDAIVDFVMSVDVPNCICTVFGVNNAGEQLDISDVATQVVTSSDTAFMTVDPPVGMTFTEHAIKATVPGAPVVVTSVATWNDASRGPFTFSLPEDIQKGGVTGLIIVPGTPMVS